MVNDIVDFLMICIIGFCCIDKMGILCQFDYVLIVWYMVALFFFEVVQNEIGLSVMFEFFIDEIGCVCMFVLYVGEN